MLLVGGVIIEKTHTLETFKLNGPAKVNQYKIDAIFNDEDKNRIC